MKNDVKFRLIALMGALALVGAGCAPTPVVDDATAPADDAMMADDMTADNENEGREDGAMMDGGDGAQEDAAMTADTSMEVDANAKVFEIGGTNFGFDVTEMRVKKGDTVKVVFTSVSGFHDWVVDEFDARTAQVRDGGVSEVTFVADEAGTFEYYCSVGRHREMGMVGTLIVE